MSKRPLKAAISMMAVSGLFLGNVSAELEPNYDPSSTALGDTTFVDLAKKGGGDSVTEGRVWWVAEIREVWSPGDQVTLTGIAIPIREETVPSNVIAFTFYDTGDDGSFDPGDIVVGTVEETYPGGDSGVWFARFAEPVNFVAKGSGVAVGFASKAGSLRLKVATEETAPGVVRKKLADGDPVETEFPNFAMSLAGKVERGTK